MLFSWLLAFNANLLVFVKLLDSFERIPLKVLLGFFSSFLEYLTECHEKRENCFENIVELIYSCACVCALGEYSSNSNEIDNELNFFNEIIADVLKCDFDFDLFHRFVVCFSNSLVRVVHMWIWWVSEGKKNETKTICSNSLCFWFGDSLNRPIDDQPTTKRITANENQKKKL